MLFLYMMFQELIFKRIFILREEFSFTPATFVAKFNSYLLDNDFAIDKKITATSYRAMERRLSTTSDLLILFVNFYSKFYDINPSWILTFDNSLISKFNIKNSLLEENAKLLKALSSIKKTLKGI